MSPIIDTLTTEDMAKINGVVRWKSSSPVSGNRILGSPVGPHYDIKDWRVDALDKRLPLFGKTVVELGCYEGGITVALGRKGALVTAVEGQAENIVNAMVRCGLHGIKAEWVLADVESAWKRPVADVYFHVGVLYHLWDPLPDLRKSVEAAQEAILLDTHYAKAVAEPYGQTRCEIHGEDPAPKNGLHQKSRWLSLGTLADEVGRGFEKIDVLSERIERNGPRVTILGTGKRHA